MQHQLALAIHRHAGGAPILAPGEEQWESGVTFNAAATYLPPAPQHARTIASLLSAAGKSPANAPDGLLAIHYRARPREDPGFLHTRSYIGLALFTPQFRLIHRFRQPLLSPDPLPTDLEYLGVEDPRVTYVDGKYVMVYCGCGLQNPSMWRATVCAAESADLLHWKKLGALDLRLLEKSNAINGARHVNNKDGVLLTGPIDGYYYLLHRPMTGRASTWAMHLARCKSLRGPWIDLGPMAWAIQRPGYVAAWPGAGAVPIDLGGGRFLEIFHSGHRAADGSRCYTLGAMVLNFNQLDAARPESVVESRIDHFMVPETRWEIEGPYPDSVGNVLFACGAFEREGKIHILYGGGDTYVMAASLDKDELIAACVPADAL